MTARHTWSKYHYVSWHLTIPSHNIIMSHDNWSYPVKISLCLMTTHHIQSPKCIIPSQNIIMSHDKSYPVKISLCLMTNHTQSKYHVSKTHHIQSHHCHTQHKKMWLTTADTLVLCSPLMLWLAWRKRGAEPSTASERLRHLLAAPPPPSDDAEPLHITAHTVLLFTHDPTAGMLASSDLVGVANIIKLKGYPTLGWCWAPAHHSTHRVAIHAWTNSWDVGQFRSCECSQYFKVKGVPHPRMLLSPCTSQHTPCCHSSMNQQLGCWPAQILCL